MTDGRLIIPAPDAELWPTLGPEVCDWIETYLVHGPGDVLGDPIELSDEVRAFLYRAYEVFPYGHPKAGRRRFKRVVLSRRKGFAKTELAAMIAILEADPAAPARCDGFRPDGDEWVPVGAPVRDPYIPMVAYTEEQTEDLAFAAVRAIIEHSPLADFYDVGLDRVTHVSHAGKIVPLAGSPSARDGARTTFQHFDETHRMVLERLKRAHQTMLRNIPKRRAADAWSLETTTMYEPGEESVAEATHGYALAVSIGKHKDPRLLFDHRQASEHHNIGTKRGLVAAIREASGDAWSYTDVDAIVADFHDPNTDEADARRFWLNQRVKGGRKWLSPDTVAALAKQKRRVRPGAPIVLVFDGSYSRDSTALVGCTVEEHPHIWVEQVWEKPLAANAAWRTPHNEVCDAVEAAMERYHVVEFAPDPPGWHREIEDWEEAYEDVVVRFDTNQPSRMGPACDDFEQGAKDGDFSHDGSEPLLRHLSHCVPVVRRGYTVVTKSSPDSPDKIDVAVGAIVAYHRACWHWAHWEDEGAELGAVLIGAGA